MCVLKFEFSQKKNQNTHTHTGYSRARQIRNMVDLINRLDAGKESVQPNLISFNTVSDGLLKSGQADAAVVMLLRVLDKGFVPDSFSSIFFFSHFCF